MLQGQGESSAQNKTTVFAELDNCTHPPSQPASQLSESESDRELILAAEVMQHGLSELDCIPQLNN